MCDSRMCSRLRTGSVETPTSPRSADTVPATSSRSASSSSSHDSAGARRLCSTLTGMPASLPGV